MPVAGRLGICRYRGGSICRNGLSGLEIPFNKACAEATILHHTPHRSDRNHRTMEAGFASNFEKDSPTWETLFENRFKRQKADPFVVERLLATQFYRSGGRGTGDCKKLYSFPVYVGLQCIRQCADKIQWRIVYFRSLPYR